MKYKVAVTVSAEYPVSSSVVREAFGESASVEEVVMPFRRLSDRETRDYAARFQGMDALLVRSGIFERDLLKELAAVRIIGVHGAGFDQIDVKAAEELGIAVANAPGANANAVVELAIAFMLMAQRGLFSSLSALKNGRDWVAAKKNGREVMGKRLGLVGVGRIGYGVAVRARALGMTVSAYDPYVREPFTPDTVAMVDDPDALFATSDIISLHVPLTDATRHLINRRSLALMKQDCILINVSRGALVNENDLIEALVSGGIAGAALDVFENEPIDMNNPLLALDNVLATPHLGGSTGEALDNVARMISEDMYRFLVEGEALRHPVNAIQRYDSSKGGAI